MLARQLSDNKHTASRRKPRVTLHKGGSKVARDGMVVRQGQQQLTHPPALVVRRVVDLYVQFPPEAALLAVFDKRTADALNVERRVACQLGASPEQVPLVRRAMELCARAEEG
jgi:hypothetical protein